MWTAQAEVQRRCCWEQRIHRCTIGDLRSARSCRPSFERLRECMRGRSTTRSGPRLRVYIHLLRWRPPLSKRWYCQRNWHNRVPRAADDDLEGAKACFGSYRAPVPNRNNQSAVLGDELLGTKAVQTTQSTQAMHEAEGGNTQAIFSHRSLRDDCAVAAVGEEGTHLGHLGLASLVEIRRPVGQRACAPITIWWRGDCGTPAVVATVLNRYRIACMGRLRSLVRWLTELGGTGVWGRTGRRDTLGGRECHGEYEMGGGGEGTTGGYLYDWEDGMAQGRWRRL